MERDLLDSSALCLGLDLEEASLPELVVVLAATDSIATTTEAVYQCLAAIDGSGVGLAIGTARWRIDVHSAVLLSSSAAAPAIAFVA